MLSGVAVPHTIARRLVVLVAASVIPVLMFAAFVIHRLADAERSGYRMQALATARALSLAIDRDMASQQATVHALSGSRHLAEGDLDAFFQRAKNVLEGDADRRIVLFDSTGQQIINTYFPLGHKLPRSNFNWAIQRVFATGTPVSSNLIIGAATGRPTVGVYVPVWRNGAVARVLAMGFGAGRISQILRDQRMPEGWIASIVDRDGVILARNRSEDLVGQLIQPEYVTAVNARSEGVGTLMSQDGLNVQAAFVRSTVTDWTTMVAVETAILEAPLNRSLVWLASGGILLLVSASCASVLYGRRIARPVAELTRMAAALGRSEPLGKHKLGLPEAQAIADQMRLTGDLLEQRNSEREVLLATLEKRVADRTRELTDSETRYREAAARAEAASQAKSRFLASMSHELRTPLSVVIGFSDILLSGSDPLTPHQRDSLAHIRVAGRQLLGLINDVLDLAKIESGRVKVTIDRVDLKDVIDTCVAMLRPMGEEKDIWIEVRPWRVQTSAIRADRTRLLQVLLNLGSNAIKYNRSGGAVIFEVGRSRSGRIRITISDTGIGIGADRQAEVFELFNRLGAENSGIEGTGIGLAICKRLVDRMRGQIGFTSDPGWGSSFWVEFPADRSVPSDTIERTTATANAIEPAAAPVYAIEPPAAPAEVRPCTVLHIDDNPAALALMKELYQSVPNVRTLTASTGEQGVALAIAHRPDIIVTDIRLPDISGYEVLRRLRCVPETKDIPVLALSAEATKSDIVRGREAGFAHYMTKPFAVDELLAAVHQALEKHAA